MVHVVVVVLVLTRRYNLGRGDKTASNDCKELVPAPGSPGVMYMTNGADSLLHTVEGRATVTASCFSGSESVTPASGQTSYFFFAFRWQRGIMHHQGIVCEAVPTKQICNHVTIIVPSYGRASLLGPFLAATWRPSRE